jgi:hypothetical protein
VAWLKVKGEVGWEAPQSTRSEPAAPINPVQNNDRATAVSPST